MILLGAPLDAASAREVGLVNAVVAGAELRDHALRQAKELAAKPPNALQTSRRLLRGSPDEVLARIREEATEFQRCLASDEAREALTAFAERRPPRFTRRTEAAAASAEAAELRPE